MTSNEILEILKKGLDNKELKSLYANQIVKTPGAQGFIQIEAAGLTGIAFEEVPVE